MVDFTLDEQILIFQVFDGLLQSEDVDIRRLSASISEKLELSLSSARVLQYE